LVSCALAGLIRLPKGETGELSRPKDFGLRNNSSYDLVVMSRRTKKSIDPMIENPTPNWTLAMNEITSWNDAQIFDATVSKASDPENTIGPMSCTPGALDILKVESGTVCMTEVKIGSVIVKVLVASLPMTD
jgi:hypothetical protein